MQLGIHIAPALPLAASRRSRTCALRLTPPRCFQGTGTDKGSKQKLTTEEITSLQPSAAEPGGEMGALDPTAADHLPGATPSGPRGSFPAGGGASDPPSRELDVDRELAGAMRPLLLQTRARLAEGSAGRDVGPNAIASAAVAAAEASGALPPLAGPQRAAVEAFFARLAEGLGEGGGDQDGFESFGSSGGAPYGDDDAVLRIRPHQRELMEAVINAHLSKGGTTRTSSSPRDSIKSGGEVGNIALQSNTHGSAEPRGVPAESESDRAERQAEAAFEQMELADLPHASAADLERQREWERHPESWPAHAAIAGDAPVAGGGLQVVEDPVEARQVGGGGSPDSESSSD